MLILVLLVYPSIKLQQGASIIPNVGLCVCWSVGLSVHRKFCREGVHMRKRNEHVDKNYMHKEKACISPGKKYMCEGEASGRRICGLCRKGMHKIKEKFKDNFTDNYKDNFPLGNSKTTLRTTSRTSLRTASRTASRTTSKTASGTTLR